MSSALRAYYAEDFVAVKSRHQSILNVAGPKQYRSGIGYEFLIADFLRHNLSKAWRMQTFSIENFDKIDTSAFLSTFIYIEAISLHLIALKEAKDLDQYLSMQRVLSKVTLYDRLSIIAETAKEVKDKNKVNKLKKILEVRNQVAHSLSPTFIKLGNSYYGNSNQKLVTIVKHAVQDGMEFMISVYSEEQIKLDDWTAVYWLRRKK